MAWTLSAHEQGNPNKPRSGCLVVATGLAQSGPLWVGTCSIGRYILGGRVVVCVRSGTEGMQRGATRLSRTVESAPLMHAAAAGFATNVELRSAAEALPAAAQRSDTRPPLDMHATTPLLRSLAASVASPVEPAQGRLAVDDFCTHPLLKRAVSYRDTYEPFDKDYTDVQIRCPPAPTCTLPMNTLLGGSCFLPHRRVWFLAVEPAGGGRGSATFVVFLRVSGRSAESKTVTFINLLQLLADCVVLAFRSKTVKGFRVTAAAPISS